MKDNKPLLDVIELAKPDDLHMQKIAILYPVKLTGHFGTTKQMVVLQFTG